MAQEKWMIDGEKTIDIESVRNLKIALIGGQVDVIGHDEPGARIEVHSVDGKPLKVTLDGDTLEIDHPQLSWDNFIDVFMSFRGTARADVSIMVPRDVALKFGVVSAKGLISGLTKDAKISTVSGDVVVDGVTADLDLNAVNGEIAVRDHRGNIVSHTVSGDVTVSGEVKRFHSDAVSGEVFLDAVALPPASVRRGRRRRRAIPGEHHRGPAASGRLRDPRHPRSVHRQVRRTGRSLARLHRQHRVRQHRGAARVRGVGMKAPVFAHGHLRLYLLSLLATEPMHGYELIHALETRFGGTYIPSAGTIYPRLAKLEDEGLVTKTTDGRKTVYAITDAGKAELDERQLELDGIESDVTDSVRRLADEVRSSVNSAMRSLRADLAASAREARREAHQTGRSEHTTHTDTIREVSNEQLRAAELVLNEFRHQVRADLRTLAARGQVSKETVAELKEQLAAVRTGLRG